MKRTWLFVLLGFVLGASTLFFVRRFFQYLEQRENGSVVLCKNGVNLSARWEKNLLDVSFFQEGGKNGNVPSEVVFHDNVHENFWIIDNIFFVDFNRDGIADAKVETSAEKRSFIRRGDQWTRCTKVSLPGHSAIDLQGETLIFRDRWP